LQFQDVPLFPTLYPIRSAPLHLYPPRPTHPTLAPHGGRLPGGINNRRGSARRVQWRGGGSAGCGVGGGTRSGGAWLRLRHATSTRPSSPPSSSYLALAPRLAAAAAAAATAATAATTAANSRPPPLTRILCSPQYLSLSLLQRHAVSFLERTSRSPYYPRSWTAMLLFIVVVVIFDGSD